MIRAKKHLGQHFLTNRKIADHIASHAPRDASVLEVGPGTGILTESLLARGCHITAVEKDESLKPLLIRCFPSAISSGQLTLITADALHFSMNTRPYHVVANIPYYITGALMRHFLENNPQPQSITVLIQKEVAERIVARDGKQSMLSIAVGVFGSPRITKKVPARFFTPQPKVDSAVVHIANIHMPFATKKEHDRFFTAVRAGFAHKRKKLISNLAGFAHPAVLRHAFAQLGIPETTRAESLTVFMWQQLLEAISSSDIPRHSSR